jgi:hypothetical protein
MTPTLALLTTAIRRTITEQQLTRAGVDELRHLALSVLDHDTSSADELREALRWALDPSARPTAQARSFKTDSGASASRSR